MLLGKVAPLLMLKGWEAATGLDNSDAGLSAAAAESASFLIPAARLFGCVGAAAATAADVVATAATVGGGSGCDGESENCSDAVGATRAWLVSCAAQGGLLLGIALQPNGCEGPCSRGMGSVSAIATSKFSWNA